MRQNQSPGVGMSCRLTLYFVVPRGSEKALGYAPCLPTTILPSDRNQVKKRYLIMTFDFTDAGRSIWSHADVHQAMFDSLSEFVQISKANGI